MEGDGGSNDMEEMRGNNSMEEMGVAELVMESGAESWNWWWGYKVEVMDAGNF